MQIKNFPGKDLPEYPVILHANNPESLAIVPELATVLDHFHLFENESAGPVPDVLLQCACCGSSFGGASARLTLEQLFAVWRAGRLIHPEYYAQDGFTRVYEKLYIVGIGYGLSGFLFRGIVPSTRTIVIADRTPVLRFGSVATHMQLYNNAAKGILPGETA